MFRLLRERLELRLIVLSGGGLLAAYVLFGLLSAWAVGQGMRESEAARRMLVDVIADRVASIVRNQVDLRELAPEEANPTALASPVSLVLFDSASITQ